MRLLSLLPLLATAAFPALIKAQCPGCVPDIGCTVSPAFPTICPAQPPEATVGEPYEADLTFWMPANFVDPGSGVEVEFQQMTVTGITGLPFGLSIEADDPSGVYFPQQNEFGCARICGIPLGAGTYTINISILATVGLGGFTTQVPEDFFLVLNVLPGSGGNTSFTFSPTYGCGEADVIFQALIEGDPSPTTYSWEFGNGNTGDQQQPAVQHYDQPGEYVISLTTTIGGYVLNSVHVSGVNGNWCGDVEEPNVPLVGCTGSPDIYFVLTDANGATYNSGTFDNTFSATWEPLALVLGNPPYSISFYDEDPISQHDLLGTYNILSDSAGAQFINIAGGTTGSLSIALEPQQSFFDTDTLVVHPLPEVTIAADGGMICVGDSTFVNYQWFHDGDTIPGANDPCVDAEIPGSYHVQVISGLGCEASSDTIVLCPALEIEQTENVLSVPGGFNSYQWSLNGTAIPGADQPFLIIEEAGIYMVEVDAGNGCIISATLSLMVGIDATQDLSDRFQVFPNPSNGEFWIMSSELLAGDRVRLKVMDMNGRSVHAGDLRSTEIKEGVMIKLDEPPGTYLLQLQNDHRHLLRKVIIE